MDRPASPAARLPGALTAQIVFALLVAATIGAFFVTTRLKRSAPVVEQLTFARYVSPNGDGRHDFVDIGFRIRRADEVTVAILSEEGDVVRTLAARPRPRRRPPPCALERPGCGRTGGPGWGVPRQGGLARRGAQRHVAAQAVRRHEPASSCGALRVTRLDLTRRGGRRQPCTAPIRRPRARGTATARVPD